MSYTRVKYVVGHRGGGWFGKSNQLDISRVCAGDAEDKFESSIESLEKTKQIYENPLVSLVLQGQIATEVQKGCCVAFLRVTVAAGLKVSGDIRVDARPVVLSTGAFHGSL
jgi:hypothetical protein